VLDGGHRGRADVFESLCRQCTDSSRSSASAWERDTTIMGTEVTRWGLEARGID